MRAEENGQTPASRRELQAQLGRIERLFGQILRRALAAQLTTTDVVVEADGQPANVDQNAPLPWERCRPALS